jgi:uncharacterized protein
MAQLDNDSESQLIAKVTAYVQQYMSHYDGSHDYAHIQRVLALTRQIASASTTQGYDALTITLSALLHDVGDKKYLQSGEDASTLVRDVLLRFNAPAELARKVQTIVSAVSYSSEVKDPATVKRVLSQYPELAVVQDADRLDALGAVGIGRAFTYGGAAGGKAGGKGRGRGMAETMEHFTEKLERLEGLMKTEVGRGMARERTERLRVFRDWWEEEQGLVGEL